METVQVHLRNICKDYDNTWVYKDIPVHKMLVDVRCLDCDVVFESHVKVAIEISGVLCHECGNHTALPVNEDEVVHTDEELIDIAWNQLKRTCKGFHYKRFESILADKDKVHVFIVKMNKYIRAVKTAELRKWMRDRMHDLKEIERLTGFPKTYIAIRSLTGRFSQ